MHTIYMDLHTNYVMIQRQVSFNGSAEFLTCNLLLGVTIGCSGILSKNWSCDRWVCQWGRAARRLQRGDHDTDLLITAS